MQIGQKGPRSRDFSGDNYPLDQREQELRGEIQSPTIPTIYERVPTMQNEVTQTGVAKAGEKMSDTDLPNTWDSVAPLSEENLHQKFVDLSIKS